MNSTNFTLPPLKYKTDTRSNNPFDVNAKENIFFYDGAFSCLVSDRKELNSFHDQSKTIVVFELERIGLVKNQHIIKNFGHPKDFRSPNNKAQFILLSNEDNISYFTHNQQIISTTSYLVTVNGKSYGPLSSMVWDDYAACRAYALKISQKSGKVLLINQILCIVDRH